MGREIDVGGTNEHLKGADLETRMQQLEDEVAVLRGDSTLRNLPYGTLKEAKSAFTIRTRGAPTYGAYPAGGLSLDTALGASSFSANYLRAYPFYMPGVPNTIVKIGIYVTAGVVGNVRVGVYADKGEGILYPGKLVLTADAFDVTDVGAKGFTMKLSLPRGLYWVVMLGSVAPTLRAYAYGAGCWAIFGLNEAGTARGNRLEVYFAYAAFPDYFPAGASVNSGVVPYIFLKFG